MKQNVANSRAKLILPSGPAESRRDAGDAAWSEIFLAALPHLLMAILTGLYAIFTSIPPAGFVRPEHVMLLAMVAAFLLAWRQGWPLWSGSWVGYWLLLLFALPGFLLPALPWLEPLILLPLLAVGVLIFQRRPLQGLLTSIPPLLLMTRLFAFELVAGGEWVWTGLWLILAVTAGAIVWLGSLRAGVLLIIGFQLVAGLAFAAGRSYLPFRSLGQMGPRQTPALQTLVNDFAPQTLAAITIPLALLLLHPLWRLAVLGGRRGQRGHTLLLLGMFITLAAVFTLRPQPPLMGRTAPGTTSTIASLAVAVGLGLSLGAAFLLARAVRAGPGSRFHALLLPLLAAFAPLVVFALARPFAQVGQYSDHFQAVVILSYSGVLLWVFSTLLAITRHRQLHR